MWSVSGHGSLLEVLHAHPSSSFCSLCFGVTCLSTLHGMSRLYSESYARPFVADRMEAAESSLCSPHTAFEARGVTYETLRI